MHACAALDEEAGNASRGELAEYRADVWPAAYVATHLDDLHTALLQRAAASRNREQQRRHFPRGTREFRSRSEPQACIEHDTDRRIPLETGDTASEQGIVCKSCFAADENGVVPGAKQVSETPCLLSGNPA